VITSLAFGSSITVPIVVAREAKKPDVDEARARALEHEKGLVARAQAGDRAAVGELLHGYGPGLYRSVLLPRLGSEAAAKDALSETYAKVVERIDRFTWQNVGFYPWLRTVALRIALDMLRAKKRMVIWDAEAVEREVDASATVTPVESTLSDRRDAAAARERVEAALGKIHVRYAKAIRLRVLEERPREECAATLEVTPATFDVLLHRSIAALKKALGDEGTGQRKALRGGDGS
jgi:RNA polymerase sigma-70 factor (ECF subfamily)